VEERLRSLVLNKLDRLGPAFLKGEHSGELATTALQGIEALDAYFSQFLPQVVLAGVLPLTIILVVFPLDLLTGVILLVTAPLIPVFMILIGKLSESVTKKQWVSLGKLGTYFLDTLQGLKTLWTLGRSKDRIFEIQKVSEDYRKTTLNVLKITFLSAFVLELVATISTAVVAVEIGLRLLYSRILFEQAFFILLITPEFYLPMRNLSMRYHAGMMGITAAARIFEILDTPELVTRNTAGITRNEKPFPHDFQLLFQQVTYVFPDSSEPVISNISLEIESGKHYALVGRSGTGKSTLAQLLLRFSDPSSGSIDLNGININSWSPEEWRKNLCWVPQKPFFFNSSLLENVRMKDPSFSRGKVSEALEKAILGKWVSQLPLGLDTPMLESGVRMSSGESQRVALARAFLKDTPIVLMDEPTSHLDLELERDFQVVFDLLIKGRTSLTIAHRLPTVRTVDQIMVLDQGRIVESGTHEELMNSKSKYFQLMKAGAN
jgi:ATP-binding cassette subfamily C protein CydD